MPGDLRDTTLVSQVEPTDGAENLGIEPLPDVDFNVVSGNTLVGYSRISHIDELWEQVQLGTATTTGTLAFERDHSRLVSLCAEYAVVGDAFRNEMLGMPGPRVTKDQVRAASNRIRPEVDQDIWRLYRTGFSRWSNTKFADFKSSHTPFHWFVEFPSVLLADGGFSAVVGNPPYVEIEKIASSYGLLGYQSIGGGNLYSLVMERSLSVCDTGGRLGMIVPVSSVCTGDFSELQDTLVGSGSVHIASFNDRPGKLFEGLEHIRLSIILCDKSRNGSIKTTRYCKWTTEARCHLFPNLAFGDATGLRSPGSIPKVSNGIEATILQRIRTTPDTVSSRIVSGGDAVLYYTRKLSGFVQVIDFVPEIRVANGQLERPSELKELRFSSERDRAIAEAALNSSLFFLYLTMVSDCRNLNQREVKAMGIPISRATDAQVQRLEQLSYELSQRLAGTSRVVTSNYKKYGRKEIQCIYPKLAKDIIDQIDIVLGEAFGLNDVELDYVVNFDIRFRMGVWAE